MNQRVFEEPAKSKLKGESHKFPCTSTRRIVDHQIYSVSLMLLENKQIRNIENRKLLPNILHPQTVAALKSELPDEAIGQIEHSVLRDVENLRDYEIIQDVPYALYADLKNQDEANLIFDNRIVPVPNSILNACICEILQRRFSSEEILKCEGFVKKQVHAEKGVLRSNIRLDIDNWLVRRGFLMPKIEDGLIIGLLVFRYPNDRKPFLLRSRS